MASVTIYDVAAAREMTEHLARLGHKRIGFIFGEPRYGASQARRQGYLEAMEACGVAVSGDWVRKGDVTFQSGLEQGQGAFGFAGTPTAPRRPRRRNKP